MNFENSSSIPSRKQFEDIEKQKQAAMDAAHEEALGMNAEIDESANKIKELKGESGVRKEESADRLPEINREDLIKSAEQKSVEEDAERVAKLTEQIKNGESGVDEGEKALNNENGIETKIVPRQKTRPIESLQAAFSDNLKIDGGLYEKDGRLVADLPWDRKMMRSVLDKVRSVSADAAEALKLLWENGDNSAPLLMKAWDEGGEKMIKGYGSKGVDVNFLRGGEYKDGMQSYIDKSYEEKDEKAVETFFRGTKASIGASAAGAFLGAGASISGFAVPAAFIDFGLLGGAAFGMATVGIPALAGVGAWRIYKNFRNKRVHKKQTECLAKL